MMKTIVKTQVCVLGAGSGGTGCVYRLVRNGIKTVVADKNSDFGGTMVFGGVDGWEPGVSLDGLHQILAKDLLGIKNGAHVVDGSPNFNILDDSVGNNWDKHSLSELPLWYCMPHGRSYENTLARCKLLNANGWGRFQFDPDCMRDAISKAIDPFRKKLTCFFGYAYKSCTVENGTLKSITVCNGDEEKEIFADFFVDCSGDIVLARDAGCDYTFGAESADEYNEPSATDDGKINGVSYVFRIAKHENSSHTDSIPDWVQSVDIADWKESRMKTTIGYCAQYPNGDINVNMLPTMEGKEYFELGDKADCVGKARVYAYWNFLQTEKGMNGWYIKKIYDAGIREGYRLKGAYVLREQDLREGIWKQPKLGRTLAIGDHSMDIHGEGSMDKELPAPYEIPLGCTMTKEIQNLFVACRGASFSHLAASSARLSRTMMSMGEGVGEYISELLQKEG